MARTLSSIVRSIAGRAAVAKRRRTLSPAFGKVDFGDFSHTKPVSAVFGFDRGTPIDRYYIERFLSDNADSIRGRVLEVAENTYTRKYGGDRVSTSDVLHVDPAAEGATVIADLTDARAIEDDTFDCIILTQTLQFIFDIDAAISELERILRPGGTVLATASGISQISRFDMDRWGDYWRLTNLSATRLFERRFTVGAVSVSAYGNVLTAVAFLEGLAVEELALGDLDAVDHDYQVTIGIRATKASRA